MNRLRCILFDHDGTLIDSEYTHYLHWKKIMKKYSIDFPLSIYVKKFTGSPTLQNALDLIGIYDLDVTAEKLVKDKTLLTRGSLGRSEYQTMPYAQEIIEFFKQKNL
jgi:beta-phosphoglucomutase-like phosphatase (HAD superfamily)